MRKVSIRLAVSILAISILVLAGGTVFGIANQTNDTGNITVNGTATGTVNATNTVNETPVVTTVQTPEETTVQTPEETTVQTPEETTVQTPEETVPIPTKSPGFESIFAIVTILSVVYIFGIRRR